MPNTGEFNVKESKNPSKLREMAVYTLHKAGDLIDKIGELSKQGKKTKTTTTGLTDIDGNDFGNIQWSEKQISTLLTGIEKQKILSLIPSLENKKCLHLSSSNETYLEALKQKGAHNTIELDVRRQPNPGPTSDTNPKFLARGSTEHLPFQPNTFDFILYPSALAWRSDLPLLIPEISRTLTDGGRMLMATIHPIFEYLMNPKLGFRTSIESAFVACKKHGIFIEELREGTVREALHHVTLSQKLAKELQGFQSLPALLILKGVRLRRRKS